MLHCERGSRRSSARCVCVCVGAFNKKYIQRGGHEAAACTNARSLCNTIKIKDASLFSWKDKAQLLSCAPNPHISFSLRSIALLILLSYICAHIHTLVRDIYVQGAERVSVCALGGGTVCVCVCFNSRYLCLTDTLRGLLWISQLLFEYSTSIFSHT